MTDLKIRAALIRLLWNSVNDDAECTCSPGDVCPECQSMDALGLGEWTSALEVDEKLQEAEKAIERAVEDAPPVTDRVTCCGSCNLAHDCDGVLVCFAAAENGRDIGRIGTVDPPWEVSPPDWCPLRTADRLVTLRVP